MRASLRSGTSATEKRRSTRIAQAVPITVAGTDAVGQEFEEHTTTVIISCHGCTYKSKHFTPKNSMVRLALRDPESALASRPVAGRVVSIDRPRTVRELFLIRLEFVIPGNVWGIVFPPEGSSAYIDEGKPSAIIRAPGGPAGGHRIARATTPAIPRKKRQWDVFICHASEDKESFVRPLAEALRAKGLRVWYDEFTLLVGDSLRRSIDRGLALSKFGAVVLSPSFFAKEWPQRELDGLVAKEVDKRRVILPVWHNVSAQDVREYSVTLADRVAVNSTDGIRAVVAKLLLVIKERK